MEEFKIPSVLPKAPLKHPEEDELKIEKIADIVKNSATSKDSTKVECPYLEPKWSDKPANQDVEYKFEILKSGSIREEIRNLQTKPYWIIGRLEQNDIIMAHPTISRFHAVLQYRPNTDISSDDAPIEETKFKSKFESGWYVYDFGSTHGTFLNKARIPPKTYIRIHVGHMLKFGASLRSYILQGPEYDEEPESELTVTELRERRKQEEELKAKHQQMQEEQREKEGISWGMTEDADEETDLSINPYATTNNEELFLDDPKKTLRGFFEREGLDLEYKCDEMSPGTFVCRIDLPIDDANGKQVTAELLHKGKKKDCVAQCALEACRILDRHGILRQSHHEPLKRKAPAADSDDEDDFLDRTGDIERKKMRKATAGQSVTLTYEDLIKQEEELNTKLEEVIKEIDMYHESSKRLKETKSDMDDDLDNYMENLTKKSVSVDKTEIRKFRVEEQRLKLEIQKVKKLIKIAKPFDLPPISGANKSTISSEKKCTSLPLFGKRNKFKFTIEKLPCAQTQSSSKELKSDEEEFDEDDENSVENVKEETFSVKGEEHESESLDSDKQKSEININDEKITNDNDALDCKDSYTRLYGPAIIPEEIKNLNSVNENLGEENITVNKVDNDNKVNIDENIPDKIEPIVEWVSKSQEEKMDNEDHATQKSPKELDTKEGLETLEEEDSNQANKKKKHRTRARQRRENVDIDDYEEFVDAEKHSDWVPPKNQSGDGRTLLNDKFGY